MVCGSVPDQGTTRTELEAGGGACVAVSWRVRRGRGTGEREAKTWLWPDRECTHLGAILRVQVLAHGYSEKGFVQGQERLMF